jgi:alpha-tubulin suppressor-like RCC1 family protein
MFFLAGCNFKNSGNIQNLKIDAVSASTGNGFSFILNKDGQVIACGDNEFAQLGLGHTDAVNSPQIVPFNKKIKIIEAGNYTSYAVDEENNLYTWGNSIRDFNIDADNPKLNLIPIKIDFDKEIKALSTHSNHLLILTSKNEVYSYGLNSRGCLGTGNADDAFDRPVKVNLPGKAIQIAAGGQHSAVLLENGDVYVWGSNEFGQLGNGGGEDAAAPIKADIGQKVKSICANDSNTYLLAENGELFSCGVNQYGQAGTGDETAVVNRFKKIPINAKIKLISASIMGKAFAVDEENKLYVWGTNGNNSISKENKQYFSTPIIYDFNKSIKFLAKGGNLFLDADNNLYCWGYNGSGQLFVSGEKVIYEPVLIKNIST